MPTLALLVGAAFATYRIGYMVSQEEGPFEVFAWLRSRFVGNTWLATGIRCFYCVSFWVALLFSGLLYLHHDIDPIELLVVWPGLAGLAVTIHKYWLR